jgi:hypothetical protein
MEIIRKGGRTMEGKREGREREKGKEEKGIERRAERQVGRK